MSIITAIFQAIGQALSFILPISESGHSAIFHDFSSRFSGACSELTGLIHIGIALGIMAAYYNVFIRLIQEFVNTFKEIFRKKFRIADASVSRKFMYYTLFPYVLMLFYFIPAGKRGNLYQFLHSFSYDGNLISEGICFLLTAVIVLFASFELNKKQKGRSLTLPVALLLSLAVFVTVPVAGFSLCASVIGIAVLCKVNRNFAFRYFVSLAAPILIVTGIIEIARCVTYVTIITGIVGVVIAAVISFFVCRLLKWLVRNFDLKYFAYYSFTIAAICVIAGIVEIIIR